MEKIPKNPPLCSGIFVPKPSNEEGINSKIKAFSSYDLYNKIYERYKGKDLPPLEILANIFARDEGVSFKIKDRTVSNFMQSGLLSGLINEENGIYHCIDSIWMDTEVIDRTKVTHVSEIGGLPDNDIKGGGRLNEITEVKDKITQSPGKNKIKISAEPFFELYIYPEEKAFDALQQL